jgi:hypothetical protein
MSTTVVPLSACRNAWRICSGVNLLFRIPGLSRPRECGLVPFRCQNGAPPGLRSGDPSPLSLFFPSNDGVHELKAAFSEAQGQVFLAFIECVISVLLTAASR